MIKRKKRKKKSLLKQYKTTAENLWKEVCKLRDRNKCVICTSTSVLQVDHCFSRKTSELFFDVRNGTTLCRECHCKKSFKTSGYDRLVDRIVKQREGAEWFLAAEEVCLKLEPFVWDVVTLEQIIIKLKEQRAAYLGAN